MEIKRTVKEKPALKGIYTFTKAFLETPEQIALDREISELHRLAALQLDAGNELAAQAYMSDAMPLIRKLNSMCRTEVTTAENLIPTVGRAALANWLTNGSPSPASLRLNYTALGTNNTAPANADTQLGTETYRKAIASETSANNVAYCTAFYTASEVSGTFYEAGVFMNATATANSGTLFSHVAVSIIKDLLTTLTIDYTITFN